jgi:hypothetical protein
MVIRLVINFGELVKVGLKGGAGKGVAGFCGLCDIWVYFCCSSRGCLCQELHGAGLCTVSTVG